MVTGYCYALERLKYLFCKDLRVQKWCWRFVSLSFKYKKEYKIDLLFFYWKLKRSVVMEVKIEELWNWQRRQILIIFDWRNTSLLIYCSGKRKDIYFALVIEKLIVIISKRNMLFLNLWLAYDRKNDYISKNIITKGKLF